MMSISLSQIFSVHRIVVVGTGRAKIKLLFGRLYTSHATLGEGSSDEILLLFFFKLPSLIIFLDFSQLKHVESYVCVQNCTNTKEHVSGITGEGE